MVQCLSALSITVVFFQYVSCSNVNERIKLYLRYVKTSYNDFSLLYLH